MTYTNANARRLLGLFERMRAAKAGGVIARMQALNLSFSHIRSLHLLATVPQLPMKELAEKLGFTPPSVTALTRRLVATGMVQRQPNVHDSRVVLLSITEAGRTLIQEIYHEQLSGMERMLDGLTLDEQQQFLTLLERAVSTLLGEFPPQPTY